MCGGLGHLHLRLRGVCSSPAKRLATTASSISCSAAGCASATTSVTKASSISCPPQGVPQPRLGRARRRSTQALHTRRSPAERAHYRRRWGRDDADDHHGGKAPSPLPTGVGSCGFEEAATPAGAEARGGVDLLVLHNRRGKGRGGGDARGRRDAAGDAAADAATMLSCAPRRCWRRCTGMMVRSNTTRRRRRAKPPRVSAPFEHGQPTRCCRRLRHCTGAAMLLRPLAGTMPQLSAANNGCPDISPFALFVLRCGMLGVNLLAIVDKLRRVEAKTVVTCPTQAQHSVHIHISDVMWATFMTFWCVAAADLLPGRRLRVLGQRARPHRVPCLRGCRRHSSWPTRSASRSPSSSPRSSPT